MTRPSPRTDETPSAFASPGDPRFTRWFGGLVAGVGVAAFIGMSVSTLLGVAARYLGLRGMDWSFEVAAILFLWTSFFGALLAEARRENVAFRLLADKLDGRLGQVLSLLGALVVLWFAISLCQSGLAFAERSGAAPTPVLRLPRIIQILPLIAFAGGTVVIIAARLWTELTGNRRA